MVLLVGSTAASATASPSAATATPGYCQVATRVLSAFATGAAAGNTKEVAGTLKSVSTALPHTESAMLAASHGSAHADLGYVFGFFNEYIKLLKQVNWNYKSPAFSKSSEYKKLEATGAGAKMTSAGMVVGAWLQTHC